MEGFMETQDPPKWKTFIWKALNNILPTTNNLLIRRVDIDPTCAMCGTAHEDIVHSLITCGYTTNIWAQSHLPIPNSVTNVFSHWFNDLMNVLDDNEIIYAVAILYYTWRARNGAVWDACLPRPQKILAMTSSTVHSWKVAHPTHAQPQTNMAVAEQGGMPTIMPPTTVNATAVPAVHGLPQSSAVMRPEEQPIASDVEPLMCYFDAEYNPQTNKAAAGAIILDTQGGYISAMTTPMSDCFTPLMAEALACKEVLSWLRDRGFLRAGASLLAEEVARATFYEVKRQFILWIRIPVAWWTLD
ncbi:PREDICTED: uncharacterized protein LOC109164742 [Ipomoea nil]|uniref:uncharacterized protein LOC109164742 n=1 Tax=Ipomoea nil TaxID=35883 RepID=UPI0009015BAE|nr:PREDICTED: uncharacterized protein LOC109164742 [Ipomoea nil]